MKPVFSAKLRLGENGFHFSIDTYPAADNFVMRAPFFLLLLTWLSAIYVSVNMLTLT